MNYLKRIWSFWRFVISRFLRNEATYRAGALTFASLLALVPLMVVILKIISLLPIYDVLSFRVQNFMFNNFVVAKGGVYHHYVNIFADQARRLSFWGTVALIVASVTVLVTLQRVFNRIWNVKVKLTSISGFLRYWASVSVAPLLLLCAVIVTSALISLPLMTDRIPIISIRLMAILPFILNVLGFTILYYAIPNCKVRWKHAFLAALCSSLLFLVVKELLGWYLTTLSVYTIVYGTFAALPIILIWLYTVWLITLLGAEVCYALGYRGHELRQEKSI